MIYLGRRSLSQFGAQTQLLLCQDQYLVLHAYITAAGRLFHLPRLLERTLMSCSPKQNHYLKRCNVKMYISRTNFSICTDTKELTFTIICQYTPNTSSIRFCRSVSFMNTFLELNQPPSSIWSCTNWYCLKCYLELILNRWVPNITVT